MEGVKQSGSSRPSLIAALVDSVGIKKPGEESLDRVDGATKTYLCATLDDAPEGMLLEVAAHYEAEATMLRAQAEASITPNSSQSFSRRAAYARLAAQALQRCASQK